MVPTQAVCLALYSIPRPLHILHTFISELSSKATQLLLSKRIPDHRWWDSVPQGLFQTCPSGVWIMPSLAPLTMTNTIFGDLSLQTLHALLQKMSHTAVASRCMNTVLVGCKNSYFGTVKWETANTELCLMTTRSKVWFGEDTGQMPWKVKEFSLF